MVLPIPRQVYLEDFILGNFIVRVKEVIFKIYFQCTVKTRKASFTLLELFPTKTPSLQS